MSWHAEALCKNMAPEFDAEEKFGYVSLEEANATNKERTKKALSICRVCPVYVECGLDAIRNREWGSIRCGVMIYNQLDDTYDKVKNQILEFGKLNDEGRPTALPVQSGRRFYPRRAEPAVGLRSVQAS